MYFRQVVWQVAIKIVIGKKQSEGNKKNLQQKQLILLQQL